MKKQYVRAIPPLLVVTATLLASGTAMTGSLDSPAAPTDANSAMYRTDDLYNRLQSGTTGVKRSAAFSEPVSTPADTGRTLNEIMTVAPAVDMTNGATPAEVTIGKTYWSLRTDSRWGLQSGTATFTPSAVTKSGQTTSYAAGDDGAQQKGVTTSSPRFTDNGNGTITDTLTGLIWLKSANCFSPGSWGATLTTVQSLNSGECGLSDGSAEGNWRLPQANELVSLVDYGRSSPALPSGHPFTGVQSNGYWTSTTIATTTANAMGVNLGTGSVDSLTKTASNNVWPVRGGQ